MGLLRNRDILAEVSDTEQSPYSERLFRDLESLRVSYPFRMRDVDLFAVAAGPGSFTGLRVGLTAVKGWAEVYGKPIAAVSALEAIAAQSDVRSGIIAAYFDARRGQVFGAGYRREPGRPIQLSGEELLIPGEEFLAHLKTVSKSAPCGFVSPNPEIIARESIELAFPGVRVEKVSSVLAPSIGRLGYERASRGELLDSLTLEANYIRRSDADMPRKAV